MKTKLCEITVCIPEHIKDLSLTIPAELAGQIDKATAMIVHLEAIVRGVLAPIASLLLRTESIASSKIEMISASSEDYARATRGNRSNDSTTSMVAVMVAISELLSSVTDDSLESNYASRLRDMQKWVGGSDHSPRGALLIPPPPEVLPELLEDLIALCNRTDLPALLQATIARTIRNDSPLHRRQWPDRTCVDKRDFAISRINATHRHSNRFGARLFP